MSAGPNQTRSQSVRINELETRLEILERIVAELRAAASSSRADDPATPHFDESTGDFRVR